LLQAVGIEALVYTSPSRTGAAPRWRVLCPFAHERQPHERALLVSRLNNVLQGALAPESWTAAQAYYWGVEAGGAPSSSFHGEITPAVFRRLVVIGTPIDLLTGLAERGPDAATGGSTATQGGAGRSDHRTDEELTRIVKEGRAGEMRNALVPLSKRLTYRLGAPEAERQLYALIDGSAWASADPQRAAKHRDQVPGLCASVAKKQASAAATPAQPLPSGLPLVERTTRMGADRFPLTKLAGKGAALHRVVIDHMDNVQATLDAYGMTCGGA
jgi:hypothetical protein